MIHSFYWLYELVEIYLWDGLSLNWLVYPLFIVTFYLHYFVIIPRMIKKPSFSSISKWFFVFFIIFAIRRYIANTILYDIGEYSPPLTEIWKWIILGVISNSAGILAVSLGSRYVKNKSKLKDLERQKVKNELSTLKNQIDIPETINILSKLEQKAKSKPESIQDEIIELSNVLRYHLYSKEGEVILSKELGIVQNQLDLYNKLNHSSIAISLEIDDRIIKTGILSKAVGEVLKHTQKVNSVLEINGIQKDTFLKISDGDSVFLSNLRNRIENMFSKQVDIENTTQAIIIKLN